MKSDFSIVIPCKNEGKYIDRLLLSIVQQTAYTQEIEIIIADDSSTDDTLKVIKAMTSKYNMNIQIIDGGIPSVARNNGAKVARGKYILFFDADVELGEADFIQKAVDLATVNNLFLISSYIVCEDGNLLDKIFWKIHGLSLKMYRVFGPFSAGMFMLINTQYFKEVGGFDESMVLGEDFELSHNVERNKFGIVPSYIKITNRRFKQDGYLRTMLRYTMIAFSKQYRQKDHRDYFQKKAPDTL